MWPGLRIRVGRQYSLRDQSKHHPMACYYRLRSPQRHHFRSRKSEERDSRNVSGGLILYGFRRCADSQLDGPRKREHHAISIPRLLFFFQFDSFLSANLASQAIHGNSTSRLQQSIFHRDKPPPRNPQSEWNSGNPRLSGIPSSSLSD